MTSFITNSKTSVMNFIRFANPYFLYLLLGIPFLCLFFVFVFKQKWNAFEKFSHSNTFQKIIPQVSFRKQKLKVAILILAYLFLVIAIARPQIGTKVEKVKRKGLDIFIALDTSLSMKAEDVSPNRLGRAKKEVLDFVEQIEGDQIGLILFSEISFVHCPLTLDYNAVRLFLDIVDSDIIPRAGTAISKSIETTIEAFSNIQPKYKIMIIFSDGENHAEGLIESARNAAEEGIKIYTVGIGKKEGTPIPLYNLDGEFIGYKKDQFSQPVLSRLKDDTLREISRITNGRYYSTSFYTAKRLYSDISALQEKELNERQFTQYAEKFHYFIAISLILLVGELILSDRRKNGSS